MYLVCMDNFMKTGKNSILKVGIFVTNVEKHWDRMLGWVFQLAGTTKPAAARQNIYHERTVNSINWGRFST